MKLINKTITIVLIISCIFAFAPRHKAHAIAATTFGGTSRFLFPCTCSGNVQYLLFYIPLYLNGPTLTAGFMGPSYALQFSYYYLHPSQHALGTYQTGAAVCRVGVEPYCVTIPNYGLILPFTGVSP